MSCSTTNSSLLPIGATGNPGANGINGTNGTAITINSGVPFNGNGINGDSYIDILTYNLYNKIGGSWILIGNIKGVSASPVNFSASIVGQNNGYLLTASVINGTAPFTYNWTRVTNLPNNLYQESVQTITSATNLSTLTLSTIGGISLLIPTRVLYRVDVTDNIGNITSAYYFN